jgi:hypothetical protein
MAALLVVNWEIMWYDVAKEGKISLDDSIFAFSSKLY